jgi:hypothetical protein
MPPAHTRSIAQLASRMCAPVAHLSYHWQRPRESRQRPLGARVVDPEAFHRALDNALAYDAFNATHYHKEA